MANPIVQQINAELEILQGELDKFKSTVEYLNGAESHVKYAVQAVNTAETNFMIKIEELKVTYDSFMKLTDSIGKVITKIDAIDFPDRLDKIENIVNETIDSMNEIRSATLEELKNASEIIIKADFDGRFMKLQTLIESSVRSNESLANTIEKQKLPEKIENFVKSVNTKLEFSFAELRKNTKQIASDTSKVILDLNIPVRMDKLDANIAGILASIQNTLARIESVERNINDKIQEAQTKQTSNISTLSAEMKQNISELQSQITNYSKRQKNLTYFTWGLVVVGITVISLLIKL